MLGCCRNFWGDFGANVLDAGVAPTMDADRVQYARARLRGTAPPRDDVPCTTCDLYETMRRDGSWLTDAEADPAVSPTTLLGVRIDAPGVAATTARVMVAGRRAMAARRSGCATAKGRCTWTSRPGPTW